MKNFPPLATGFLAGFVVTAFALILASDDPLEVGVAIVAGVLSGVIIYLVLRVLK